MAERSIRSTAAYALAAVAACLAGGSGVAAQSAGDTVDNSAIDAPLFYQLLIGEMELRGGAPGTAFEVVLDAARKTKDEQLYRRATDIALQARAGDQALSAVKAWRAALPASLEAMRYEVQLLVALNRTRETSEALRTLISVTAAADRPGMIVALPRFFSRATDRKAAVTVLNEVLAAYLDAPATGTAARVALGRVSLAAQDPARALELARQAHAREPAAEAPALLALELLPGTAAAEQIVTDHLAAKPQSNSVRVVYARMLSATQRFADAVPQLEAVARSEPQAAAPWLSLGALQLEMKHPQQATLALQKYLQLAPAVAARSAPPDIAETGADDEEALATPDAGITQAYLMLAQAAEQQSDFPAAERWLAKVDNPQRALEVQARRASLLARQGKLREARELIRQVPEKAPEDARAKLLAEAQILRDAKQWADALGVLAAANAKFPKDADLLYEQSMVAEKLDRMDEMERLLRQVIEIKPDYHHAYNALGYSLAERNLRLPEARTLIRKALELVPGEPFITDSLGWVEYRLGNREEAVRLLRQAYQSRPDTEIATHLGEVLWVSGQREEARRVLRDARTRDSSNDVLRETLARLQVDL